jgi:hypothetical protein
LEQALRSAERIVVDGDASLAAYAAHLAGAGMPAPEPDHSPTLKPLDAAARAAHPQRTARPPRLWPWVLGAGMFAVGAAAAVLLEHFSQAEIHAGHAIRAGIAAQLDPWRLVWPAAAVAVLLALFFVARGLIGEHPHGGPFWRLENAPLAPGRPLILARVPRRLA